MNTKIHSMEHFFVVCTLLTSNSNMCSCIFCSWILFCLFFPAVYGAFVSSIMLINLTRLYLIRPPFCTYLENCFQIYVLLVFFFVLRFFVVLVIAIVGEFRFNINFYLFYSLGCFFVSFSLIFFPNSNVSMCCAIFCHIYVYIFCWFFCFVNIMALICLLIHTNCTPLEWSCPLNAPLCWVVCTLCFVCVSVCVIVFFRLSFVDFVQI